MRNSGTETAFTHSSLDRERHIPLPVLIFPESQEGRQRFLHCREWGDTVGAEDGKKENSSTTQLVRGEVVGVPPTNKKTEH